MDLKKIPKRKPAHKVDWPQQPLHESVLNSALNTVESIEPRLHKINLSGIFNYADIKQQIEQVEHKRLKRMKPKDNWMRDFYNQRDIVKFPNFNISIFTFPLRAQNPKNPANSYFQIDTTRDIDAKTHKDFLIRFDKALPDLNASKVEYAVDLFCSSPQGVLFLNDVVRRYLYAKYQKKVWIRGDGERTQYGKRYSIENMVTNFDFSQKVYERGTDATKQKDENNQPYWIEDALDRLRLEFTARREKSHLLKFGINKLRDLIQNPRFVELNLNKWQFRQFRKRAKKGTLPRPWQYPSRIFQQEYLNQDNKNRSRILETALPLEILELKILLAMVDFNENWCSL